MKKYLQVCTFLLFVLASNAQDKKEKKINMFQANPEHNGVYRTGSSSPNLGKQRWKFQTNSRIFSSAVVSGNKVFVGSEDKNLYAINRKTGKELWRFRTEGIIRTSPAVYENKVYFGSADGYYYAVDSNTGKELWKFKTGGEHKIGTNGLWGMTPIDQFMEDPYDFFFSSPVLSKTDNELMVYFGSSDGNLYALNAVTGQLKWSFKTNGIIRSTPAVYKGKVYTGSWDTYIYAIDAAKGQEIWKFKTGSDSEHHVLEGIQASASVADGCLYIGSRDGFFYALDADSGSLKWKYNAESSWVVSTASVKDSTVYVGTSDSYLFLALDTKTGKEKFRIKTHGYNLGSPALAGNKLLFGDFSGKLYAINVLTGKPESEFETESRKAYKHQVLDPEGNLNFIYTTGNRELQLYKTNVDVLDEFYKLGSFLSSPVVYENVVYIGSADGALYAIAFK